MLKILKTGLLDFQTCLIEKKIKDMMYYLEAKLVGTNERI